MTVMRARCGPAAPARRGPAAAVIVAVVALVSLFGAVAGQRAVVAPAAAEAGAARAAPRDRDVVATSSASARHHDGRPRRAEAAPVGLTGARGPSWPELTAVGSRADAAAGRRQGPNPTRSRAPPS